MDPIGLVNGVWYHEGVSPKINLKNTCVSIFFTKLSFKLVKEYYERLVLKNYVGFRTMIIVISFGITKRVASLDELQ